MYRQRNNNHKLSVGLSFEIIAILSSPTAVSFIIRVGLAFCRARQTSSTAYGAALRGRFGRHKQSRGREIFAGPKNNRNGF